MNKVNGLTFHAGDSIFFKAGGVWGEVLVADSGSSAGYVSYGAYGAGNKPRLLAFQAIGKSYVKVNGLEFRNGGNYQAVRVADGSHHIAVNNCSIFADTTNTANAAMYIRDSHHIEVTNSELSNWNLNHQGDALILQKNTQYCLIENNKIGSATHYALTLQGSDSIVPAAEAKYNILRNNVINNSEGALLELQSNSNYNLVEGNVITGGKSVSYNVNLPRSFKNVSKGNIIRFNIVKDNPAATSSGLGTEVYAYRTDPPNIATQNHVYNNVITNITKDPLVIATNGDSGASVHDNFFKNNIIYNNGSSHQLSLMKHSTIYDNFFSNNLFFKAGVNSVLRVGGDLFSVLDLQKIDGAHFNGNLQEDPKLDGKFAPLAGSPCIDAGDFLTRDTSQGGAGNTLRVADSGYFFDGFGIVPGDTIRVGDATATIVSIDRSTHVLTLAESITWKGGAPVSLIYSGAKPDIGILEYRTARPPSPLNLQLEK